MIGNARDSDGGLRFPLPIPPSRHKTVHPGVFWREKANGDRAYEINYYDSAGKRQFKSVPGGLKDAVRERTKILERMHKGQHVAPSKIKIAEFCDEYLETATSHLRPSTKAVYEGYIEAQVKPRLGHYKVSDLNVHHVALLIADMRKEGKAANTIANTLKPLSGMYRLAVRRGLSAQNPVHELSREERPKGYTKMMRILSTEEIAAVLRNADKWMEGHYRLLLETAIFTGLRVGELCRLEWQDVDFEESILRVRYSKTEAGVRDVVVPDFLLRKLAGRNELSSRVFTTKQGRPITKAVCSRALERGLKGVTEDTVRFHDLRHTFASLLIGQGEDVVYVSEQLGHANPAITLKVYAKLYDKEKRMSEARKRMDAQFGAVVA